LTIQHSILSAELTKNAVDRITQAAATCYCHVELAVTGIEPRTFRLLS